MDKWKTQMVCPQHVEERQSIWVQSKGKLGDMVEYVCDPSESHGWNDLF